jgi:perosamine synthetase
MGKEEAEAACQAIRSGWVGQGPRVAEFEARLASLLGAPHAVVLSSGTAALHLALLAMGIGPGDEVLVPASSFIATANAVLMTGARPVFADVNPRTANLDVSDASLRVTPRTRALLVVHQLGLPADLHACRELCNRHGLRLVEDAACALGSRYGSEPIGRPHGLAACFSFHPRKVITTGEGGAVTTADAIVAERIRHLRNHGAEPTGLPPHRGGAIRYPILGYNARMSDLEAAVGLEQLDRLQWLLGKRAALAARYDSRLRGHSALDLPSLNPPGVTPSWQSYQVLLTPECPLSADAVAIALAEAGVDSRPGLTALHLEPLYLETNRGLCLPGAEQIAANGLMLPLHPGLSDSDVDLVCHILLDIFEAGRSGALGAHLDSRAP